MNKLNPIGVDLAKSVIQVSVLSPSNRELRNSALTRRKFAEFLGRQRPSLVAFEACATAHYWARTAQRHGHQVKIIPAKVVAPFRQGHKTDEIGARDTRLLFQLTFFKTGPPFLRKETKDRNRGISVKI